MKKFLFLILSVFVLSSALATDLSFQRGPVIVDGEYRFLVKELQTVDELDFTFVLWTTNTAEKLILDCQSFIHGLLLFWDYGNGYEQIEQLMLDEKECAYIAFHALIYDREERLMCLRIHPSEWTISIGGDPNNCYR